MFEKALKLLTVSAFIVFPISTIAQEDSVSSEIEEITVTGSQIKGAKLQVHYRYLFLIFKTWRHSVSILAMNC